MRNFTVSAFISLDGVVQAPGGPNEDPSGGFDYGGWTTHYADEVIGAAIDESFARPFDLLLGRNTYDIFAAHWPYVETDPSAEGFSEQDASIAELFNRVTKYVATHSPNTLSWQNSQWLGEDVVATLRDLKKEEGPDLWIWGSSRLIQTLLAADLIDEFQLLFYPLVLGKGKRLFDSGTMPAAFELVKSTASPNGVLIATYKRAGEIQIGSFALDPPSEAELERRKNCS
ncbi:dihydrofolate reductase family protein [Halomonas binhaiensis]|uniref:Dihydrofolate reductase family protein n=1 Tax=Halomonas binhaiensis TaxID=2562282 RepID=A0A5C1NJ81_9GAMM|nr:dihydrofolate reductase family protein [Halomonas binhaiensis]QEM81839.1 dihydrofolate reductase family protein [Halomonas binhaiensis]